MTPDHKDSTSDKNLNSLTPQDVLVVIPAYNEEKIVASVITNLQTYGFKVLCVVDGCTDKTLQEVKTTGCLYLHHMVNLGQGASLESGFELVRNKLIHSPLIATFDSDGQHRASDLLAFLDAFNNDPSLQIILGSRFINNSNTVPFSKRVILKTFAKLSQFTLGVKVTDRHNGLRMITASVLDSFHLQTPGYGHADEFLRLIKRAKLNFTELPTEILYTEYSRAKGQRLSNGIKILFDGMMSSK